MWKKAPLRDKKDTLNVVTPLQHSGLKNCSKNDIFHFPCNYDEIVLSCLILHQVQTLKTNRLNRFKAKRGKLVAEMWLPENSLLIQVYIYMHREQKCQKVQFGRFRIMLELTSTFQKKKFKCSRHQAHSFIERVVNRLPLMTCGLKLSLEF